MIKKFLSFSTIFAVLFVIALHNKGIVLAQSDNGYCGEGELTSHITITPENPQFGDTITFTINNAPSTVGGTLYLFVNYNATTNTWDGPILSLSIVNGSASTNFDTTELTNTDNPFATIFPTSNPQAGGACAYVDFSIANVPEEPPPDSENPNCLKLGDYCGPGVEQIFCSDDLFCDPLQDFRVRKRTGHLGGGCLINQNTGEEYCNTGTPKFDDLGNCYCELKSKSIITLTCITDSGEKGVNTAIGCISISNENENLIFLLTWAGGILGGTGIILIIYGGFLIMSSQGDRNKVALGKEVIFSAVMGIVFIIISAFLLRTLGTDILNLPGF